MNQLGKGMVGLTMLLFLAVAAVPAGGAPPAGSGVPAGEALKMLQEGGARFLAGKPKYPHQGLERRALTAGQGQHPFAALLACSDSRVPVELIFDQGIGDLFVVRVAGNVAGADEIGSLEFAVDQLGTSLIVVLGHTQCGAVAAVLDNAKGSSNLTALMAPIKPAVDQAREGNPDASPEVVLNAAIKANVFQAIEDLLGNSPLIRDRVKSGQVKVLGALYELDTGQVQWLGPHPEPGNLPGTKGKTPGGKPTRKTKKSKPTGD